MGYQEIMKRPALGIPMLLFMISAVLSLDCQALPEVREVSVQSRQDVPYLAFSRWKPLHIGGGGAITDIETSARAGTLYVGADMEGIYRSDDYGRSWNIRTKGLGNVFSRVIRPHPTEADTVYLGTMTGVWKSTDGANNWQRLGDGTDLDGTSVQCIVFDPNNPSILYVGPGIGTRENALQINGNIRRGNLMMGKSRQSHFFKSVDGGVHWEKIQYTKHEGDPGHTVFDVAIDPTDSRHLYLASSYGVFKSTDGGTTWVPLQIPETAPRGVAITPDGSRVYATFRGALRDGSTGGIYTARTGAAPLEWVRIDQSMPERGNYWPIQLDPFDATGRTLYVGCNDTTRVGLFKGTIEIGAHPTATWEQVLKGRVETSGWLEEHAHNAPIVRHFCFSKPTWGERKIWTSTGMSLYEANLDEPDGPVWQERYSQEREVLGSTFYSGRGFESTFVYDVVMKDNYMAAGMADHGFVESYDNGRSWREVNFLYPKGAGLGSNSRASVLEFMPNRPDIMLAGLGWGYGAGNGGVLYARDVDSDDPSVGSWSWLAGGPAEKNGLVNEMISTMLFDSSHPNRVYLGLQRQGIYKTDQLDSLLLNGRGSFESITTEDSGFPAKARVYNLLNDPLDSGRLYAATSQGLYVGAMLPNGSWSWKQRMEGLVFAVAATKLSSSQAALFCIGKKNTEQDAVWLSLDQGMTWKAVLREDELARRSPTLSSEDLKRYRYVFSEIKAEPGQGGTVYLSVTGATRKNDNKMVRSNGDLFAGTLQDDGTVSWTSIQGGLAYSHANRLRLHEENGQPVLYSASRGAGIWKRAPSLIGNGGFELDLDSNGIPDYWTLSTNRLVESGCVLEGHRALRICDPLLADVRIQSSPFSIPGGATCTLGYAISSFPDVSGVSGHLIIKDREGRETGRIDLPIPSTVEGGWKNMSATVRFPADAATFLLEFSSVQDAAGKVWLDDLYLELVD